MTIVCNYPEREEQDKQQPESSLVWAAIEKHDHATLKRCIRAGIDFSMRDDYGSTPLHVAAFYGNADACKLLLPLVKEGRIDLEATDDAAQTAFHAAAMQGHERVMEMLLAAIPSSSSIAPLEETDVHGETPLSWAKSRGHAGIVTIIEQFIADRTPKPIPPIEQPITEPVE